MSSLCRRFCQLKPFHVGLMRDVYGNDASQDHAFKLELYILLYVRGFVYVYTHIAVHTAQSINFLHFSSMISYPSTLHDPHTDDVAQRIRNVPSAKAASI